MGSLAAPTDARMLADPASPPCRMSVEHELVSRALEGDGAAFRQLVEPHLPMVFRLAARASGGDRALAEDALQDALELAYRRLGSYRPGTSLRAFLAAIAVQRARTLRRGERRRIAREEAFAAPDEEPSPASLAQARRTEQRIAAALDAMPARRRTVALLRLDAGLSYAEIAQIVGGTEGAARVLVHAALQQLRERLGDLLPGGQDE